ncbi:hypothetical protein SAMN04489729_6992 [Amycolatopsis lurida]|uniref:Uncharacterized protein n=1 Tax=Amycolatopsis lurida NRRL 2430 TaxID=1460371 RepID=A0A2P2FFC6_AMYLU|nr:hypothetical protein [Amycolatopsis lurida]KFU75414.1 hypothetical protein BB31_41650 [Amycolatopsis lurida NRRL 2430]SEE29759.1 hypothetical protein SAMN04489729_6992 [Amycolatopsis lurida]
MNSRDWVVQKLRDDKRVVTPVSDHGLVVTRPGRPNAVAYCCDRSTIRDIDANVVFRVLHELPQTQMIITFLSSQLSYPDAYDLTSKRGIYIGTFGDLNGALHDRDDIGTYQHREEKYLRTRMSTSRAVTRVLRKGHRAWLLQRLGRLRPLTIITSDEYEVTDRDFTTALDQHPTLAPDAFIATSPNAQGFSDRVSATARDAGIKLLTMNDFVRTLREPWT